MSSPLATNRTSIKPYVAASDLADAKDLADSTIMYNGRCAQLKLHIVVVGCGLGGLAAAFTLSKAGHRVTILESASALGEIGAAIQISPNASRLFNRWGLGPALERIAVRPQAIVYRKYDTGEIVAYSNWGDGEQLYSAPFLSMHRADLHRLLVDLIASTPDVTIRLNATVTSIDPADPPRLTLHTGEIVDADLIVGADGIKSVTRQAVIGGEDHLIPGDAAYRAVLPCSLIENDAELREFFDTPMLTGWMGPGRHIMLSLIRAKKEFNLIMIHPYHEEEFGDSWITDASADQMRTDFADFEPKVQKLLAFVSETLKWKIMDREPLHSWIHASGRVVLLGDACHPMLPYRAQGAAMVIEDAAVLGNLLSHLSHTSQLIPLLHAYQDLRLPRTTETQRSSRVLQRILHLPDGAEQEARDASMRGALGVEGAFEGNANLWVDRGESGAQFGYDADEEAERWWWEVGVREMGMAGAGEGGS